MVATISVLTLVAAAAAHADDAGAPATTTPAASWASTIKWSGHLEAGVSGNPDSPSDGVNFGQLFTDRANQVLLNSEALTVERDPDASAKTLDLGFKVQAAYGSDARFTQLIGEFNRSIDSRNQFDIVEAHLDAHAPWLTAGGMELHAGVMPTLEGAEVMDPTGNFFYSRSYIFDFGTPLKYTGVMTETHLTPLVDLYAGLDTGLNTFVGPEGGANARKAHFHGGVGFNFKTLTILATTQIGPEDYTYNYPAGPTGARENWYVNDVTVTWKLSDRFTTITDLNYIYSAVYKAGGGGVAEYLTYVLSPTISVGARGEVWRDDHNFFVYGFPGYHDYINYSGGYAPSNPTTVMFQGAPASDATYAELTFGVNWKPAGVPKALDGLTFRPEVRFDTLLTHGLAYDAGAKSHQVTIGADLVAPFVL